MEKNHVCLITQSAGSAELACSVQGLFSLLGIMFLTLGSFFSFLRKISKILGIPFTRGQLLKE